MTDYTKQQRYHYPAERDALAKHLKAESEKGWAVLVKPYVKDRSLDQNYVSHGWYKLISETEREYSPETVKCICKLDYGLPILRADDPEVNELCARVIDAIPLREHQIRAMRLIDVTSLMTTAQMSQYMGDMQHAYAGRVDLRFQDEPPINENIS